MDGSTGDGQLEGLKAKIRDAKLQAKSGGASLSPEEIAEIKAKINAKKLERKHESLARAGGEAAEPSAPEELAHRLHELQRRVGALHEAVQSKSPSDGSDYSSDEVNQRLARIDQLKHSIRVVKVEAKQAGSEPRWSVIQGFKDEIRLWDLWNTFDLLDTKWSRWGGGDIDPAPFERISHEVASLERKVGSLSFG